MHNGKIVQKTWRNYESGTDKKKKKKQTSYDIQPLNLVGYLTKNNGGATILGFLDEFLLFLPSDRDNWRWRKKVTLLIILFWKADTSFPVSLGQISTVLTDLTAPAAGETHPSAARIGDKKAHHGQRKYGCAGEDSPQPGNTMDEPLLFHLPGDQLAHLNEVLGCKILQAKKAEGCV